MNDPSKNLSSIRGKNFRQLELTAAVSADHKITRVISDTGYYINKTAVESLAFGPDQEHCGVACCATPPDVRRWSVMRPPSKHKAKGGYYHHSLQGKVHMSGEPVRE